MSTDKQSSDSPADQIARCRAFAAQRGLAVVEALVVSEAGISGASRHNRPGLLSLFERIAEWNVLLCWDSSRLSRDSEDLGWIRNRLRSHRRTGFEVSTGLDLFNVGAKVLGVMAEEYLVKLRADTQRGLRGRAERGLSTGGLAYGYRSEPVAIDEHGRAVESAGFRVVIDDAAAEIVRRIFDAYASGEGYRTIAHGLNADGIASPRGKGWSPTAIYELIRNPIYRGERIFNRSEWIKDRETGQRRRFDRPPEEWVRHIDESLRIVSDDSWQRAQERGARRRDTYPRGPGGRLLGTRAGATHRVPTKFLLSGLLACGECGGAFYGVKRSDRLCCSWRVDRGADVCESALVVPRADLEERVLGALRDRVFTPENLRLAVETAFGLARRELARGEPAESDPSTRLEEIERQIENATRLAARTGRVDAVARVIGELEQERAELRRALAEGSANPRPDAATILAHVERWASEVRTVLSSTPAESRQFFRVLLDGRRIRVLADEERAFRVEGAFTVPWMHETPSESVDSRGGMCGSGGGI